MSIQLQTLTQKDLIEHKGIWHAIKQQHIESIFSKNHLEARTVQRHWSDGMTYRDNQGDIYQNSHYMKGWSMTRDKDYAFSWGSVALLLDWEKIKRDFKVKTISWSYRGAYCNDNFDREREEFVISNFMHQTMDEIKEEFFSISDQIYDEKGSEALDTWRNENGLDYIEYWQRKGLRTIDLSRYLKGVFVCKESYENYKGRGFELAVQHPLFKGFVDRKQANKRHSASMQDLRYRLPLTN